MYTSDLPGNGKTFNIQRDIRRFEENHFRETNQLANMSDFQKEANPNLQESKSVRSVTSSTQVDVDEVTEHLLIGGEISEQKLKTRLAKIRRSTKTLRHLVIKIDYIENLLSRRYLLNDFLFMLCFFKCFFLGDEPFFLPESLRVKIEVQNYFGDFLSDQITLLGLLPSTHSTFDIRQLEFPWDSVFNPVQTTCFFIDRVINKLETHHFGFYPVENPLNRFTYDHRPESVDPEALTKEEVVEILEANFVNNSYRKGQLTFAGLMFFCKMASNEFRNLNHNCLLDYRDFADHEDGLNVATKKPDLFRIVLQICVRSTNQSVEAISTQEQAFGKLKVEEDKAK